MNPIKAPLTVPLGVLESSFFLFHVAQPERPLKAPTFPNAIPGPMIGLRDHPTVETVMSPGWYLRVSNAGQDSNQISKTLNLSHKTALHHLGQVPQSALHPQRAVCEQDPGFCTFPNKVN